jgi:hypothetical protein
LLLVGARNGGAACILNLGTTVGQICIIQSIVNLSSPENKLEDSNSNIALIITELYIYIYIYIYIIMRVQVDAISGGEDYTINFKDVIDNRACNYHIALKEISYVVGYYNISSKLGNNLAEYSNGTVTKTVKLPDGFYTIDTYFAEIHDQMKIKGGKYQLTKMDF